MYTLYFSNINIDIESLFLLYNNLLIKLSIMYRLRKERYILVILYLYYVLIICLFIFCDI